MARRLSQTAPCPRCGSPQAVKTVAQAATAAGLVWSRSLHCAVCGLAEELDDRGFPPAEDRQALIESDGGFRLQLGELAGHERLTLARTLADQLGGSSRRWLSLLKGNATLCGTEVELEHVAAITRNVSPALEPRVARAALSDGRVEVTDLLEAIGA